MQLFIRYKFNYCSNNVNLLINSISIRFETSTVWIKKLATTRRINYRWFKEHQLQHEPGRSFHMTSKLKRWLPSKLPSGIYSHTATVSNLCEKNYWFATMKFLSMAVLWKSNFKSTLIIYINHHVCTGRPLVTHCNKNNYLAKKLPNFYLSCMYVYSCNNSKEFIEKEKEVEQSDIELYIEILLRSPPLVSPPSLENRARNRKYLLFMRFTHGS